MLTLWACRSSQSTPATIRTSSAQNRADTVANGVTNTFVTGTALAPLYLWLWHWERAMRCCGLATSSSSSNRGGGVGGCAGEGRCHVVVAAAGPRQRVRRDDVSM